MAKARYYAVKKGRSTGIFTSWEECKDSVAGFAGAEYKSFSSESDARDYLDGAVSDKNPEPPKKRMTKEEKIEYYRAIAEKLSNEIPEGKMVAYVDGSFDAETQRYSCGCVMVKSGDVSTYSSFGLRPEAVSARNVAGELTAAMYAVKTAASAGIRDITIYHDYYGISKWYTKEWKAQSFCAKNYIDFMEKYRPYMDISFVKVEGHSGVPLNEYADILAKGALEKS